MSHLDKLTALQQDLIRGFFARESGFFLTGGAALVGFYLGHRTTHDLDLFTTSASLDRGDSALADTALALGGTVEKVTTAPDIRRRLVRRAAESVIVDLVHDRSPQGSEEKPLYEGVRLDPPQEILANKLCTLLSRAEIRDLVDVRALELAGHDLEQALVLAARKDGGLSPGQLAWVLSQIEIQDQAELPGAVSPQAPREFLAALVSRLARLAWPDSRA